MFFSIDEKNQKSSGNERTIPQGESLEDFQEREPWNGWEGSATGYHPHPLFPQAAATERERKPRFNTFKTLLLLQEKLLWSDPANRKQASTEQLGPAEYPCSISKISADNW